MATRLQTTPIRAITSPLSSRSSPTIPPPSQTYEPFVKSVLRFRLVNRVFLYSAGLSWAHAVIWSLWGQGGFSELGAAGACLLPFQPWTVVAGLATWAFVALPSAVLRKVFLTRTFLRFFQGILLTTLKQHAHHPRLPQVRSKPLFPKPVQRVL